MMELDLEQTGGVSGRELTRVLKEKMPPIARKVVLIDFDDTIAPFGFMFSYPEPFPGVAEFTKGLRKKGYSIGIFTSRLSPTWIKSASKEGESDNFRKKQRRYIQKYCDQFGITFDFMTSEKVPCEAYIDDKAIRFEGNWSEIAERWAINVTK